LAQGALAAASVGGQLYQSGQQEKALKEQAKYEQRAASAQQAAYIDRVNQVLSLNVAEAAGRGVVGGGSNAAIQSANLRGGQIDIGAMRADSAGRMSLYEAARRNTRLGGYANAATSLFSMARI
jgi:hypothetical protein